MSAFSSIIGHEAAARRLSLMIANDRVPHALLIHGPRRVGKRALAEAFARVLIGVERLESHPDFRLVERGRDEKTGKLRKGIGVDEVRGLREHFQMSSFLGGVKVALIDEAEKMNDEASNALLKTLEEPAGRACILLVSHEPEALLPTVRSRLSSVPLRRVAASVIEAALSARGASDAEASSCAAMASGRPGLALSFLEKNAMLEWYANEERRWRALRSAPLHERFALAGDLTPPKADREETVERLRDAMGVWEESLRRELRGGAFSAARTLRSLFSLRASLEANVQPRLLVERFLLSFDTP